MYPDVADKLKFIQLRKPAFEKLLTQYQFVSSVNTFGFGPLDISSVKYALDNPNIIFEYAGILKTTEDFAKQELSMLYNSVMSEQFRIFAVCNYWKDTINKATTKEDIDSIILKIPKSFSLQGGIDD
jgi:hypothetical protein